MNIAQKTGVMAVAALMMVIAAQASSSTNGAPGRSDFNKRKSMRSLKSPKPREVVAAPKPNVLNAEKTSDAVEQEPIVSVSATTIESTNASTVITPADTVSLSGQTNAPTMLKPEESAPVPAEMAGGKVVPPVAPRPPIAVIADLPTPVPTVQSATPAPTSAHTVAMAVLSESALKISYADVLTERQKAVLKLRAEDLKLKEDDYDKLLSPDEKERLDSLVRERRQAVVSGE